MGGINTAKTVGVFTEVLAVEMLCGAFLWHNAAQTALPVAGGLVFQVVRKREEWSLQSSAVDV